MNSDFTIRIGNQTSFSASSPMAPFEFALAHGFTAFEWFPDKKEEGQGWEINDLDGKTRGRIRKTAKKHNMSLAVHAPWQASPRAIEDLEILEEHIRFSHDIGATLLNIHCDTDRDIQGFAQALLPLITQTKEAGIKLAIENTVMTSPEEFNNLFQVLRNLAAEEDISHVGICFDMGHANLCSATHNDYIGYLDRLNGNIPIIHLHCHENFGDRDSHLPLFTGPAGRNEAGISALLFRMAARGFHGALIMEQWPEPPTLLIEARDRISKIINTLTGAKKNKISPSTAAPPKQAQKKNTHPPPFFAEAIAAMDRKSRSWREKLLGVKTLLQDYGGDNTEEQLTYLAIYLRFLNTGEIVCVEDGRHFRPSHHARTSLEIQEMLFKNITPQTVFVVRKILPWLPSFEDDFMRREPLTRIRDIAHRNDIPQDLKKEIKHNLQNKLHRCAGPEDLQTAGNILNRITASEAHYQERFVKEFQIFYSELQEFFNANSLESRLAALSQEDLNSTTQQAVSEFLAVKRKKKKNIEQLIEILEKDTALRAELVPEAYRSTDLHAQNRRMAEIQLEDYAFAVFSELINELSNIPVDQLPWSDALQAVALAVTQVRLSSIATEECAACESMLAAWKGKCDLQDRESLLLINSLLNRCRRLTGSYRDTILAMFAEKAKILGTLLALPEHAVRTFAEGDIRGSMVFQLARLTSLLLGEIRNLANLPPWDIIVAGRATGRLTALASLEEFRPVKGKDHILMLAEATGSEEIPQNVTAIILCRPIPHLSHLAIRTRQENILLIALLDPEAELSLAGLRGKDVSITATSDGVSISKGILLTDATKTANTLRQTPVAPVSLDSKEPVLALADAQLATCGNKAFAAGRLADLARSHNLFQTPSGGAIPFGVAEKALKEQPARYNSYKKLLEKLVDRPNRNLETIIAELREIFLSLSIDPVISKQVANKLGVDKQLMVRSSANCEDMEIMSGAGLYDSIANVSLSAVDDAVRQVWASLWNKRAIISRERAGINHSTAHMAILIQEMINPDYAFVLHTTNPINNSSDELYMEVAVGLGETLASAAQPGSPLRMICSKENGDSQLLTFADFSRAARSNAKEGVCWTTLDYSKDPLTCDRTFRRQTAARLCSIGVRIEKAFGRPQDIEGVIKGDEVYLVQSRVQMTQE